MKVNIPFVSFFIFVIGCAAPRSNYLIGVNPEGAIQTEIVVFDIKTSNYALNANLQSVLPKIDENYSFAWGDWDLDGFDDLFAINRKGYKSVDLYILSGASSYKSFLLQQPINYPICSSDVDFSITDWNDDKIPDLIIFQRNKANPIQVQILNGTATNGKLAFHSIIEAFPLTFADPNNEMFFAFADYNMDKIEDLIVAKSSADSNVIVNFYTKDNKFATLKQSNKTALPKGNGIYKFAFGEGMTEGLLDLFTIDYSIPNAPRVKKSFFLVGYSTIANNDLLPYPSMNSNMQYFTAKTIKTKDAKIRAGEVTTFNPKPLLAGDGPKDISFLDGKWETNYAIHSDDNNSISGLVITKLTDKEKQTANGIYQEVLMQFEDGYSIICTGENGNIEFFTNEKDRKPIKSELRKLNSGVFNLTLDNKEYRFNQYIEEANYSFITIKNAAGYVSKVTASWSFTSFGGKVVNEKSSTEKLDAIFKTTKYLVVPIRAKDFKIHVNVVGGVDWGDLGDCSQFTILPVVDGGCYRITGTTLNPGYDRNCNSNSEIDNAMKDPMVNAFMDYFKGIKVDKIAKGMESIIKSRDLDQAAEIVKLNKLIKDLSKAYEKSIKTSAENKDLEVESVMLNQVYNNLEQTRSYGLCYNTNEAFVNKLISRPKVYSLNKSQSGSMPSISMGFGAEAASIIGGVVELGSVRSLEELKYKISFANASVKYVSAGASIGYQFGVDAYMAITLNNSPPNELSDGWAFGFSFALGGGPGVGIIIWINDAGEYTGVSFMIMIGVKVALNAQAVHTDYTKK